MRRTFSRRDKLLFAALAVFAALVALMLVAAAHLKPVLTSLATARVANTVTRIVTAAVNETVYEGDVDYDSLISLEKDTEGHIVALKSDEEYSSMLPDAVTCILVLKTPGEEPRLWGMFLSELPPELLAGRGPEIRVRMQSVGSPSAHFENAFTSAGINQTKHQILLSVDVSVGILLPGFTTATKVSNRFSVAETVIVGSVPENYTYFNSSDITSTAEDYVMNQG